ncbi:MAG: hypothetical protein V3T74_06085 [Gemmatimonadales bacterium]
MAGDKKSDRRASDRRDSGDRRSGKDRRCEQDRREKDAGPPTGMRERRTGWERRIAQQRSGGDRRSGLDRRDITPEAALRAVAVQTLRQLVSRLYFQTSRAEGKSERTLDLIAQARTELLTSKPDLDTVRDFLGGLKGLPVARLPEYRLAKDLLSQIAPAKKGGKKAAKKKAPFRRRDSLELLRETLAAPLKPSPSASKSKKKPAAKKATKKTSKKATKKATKGRAKRKKS